MHIEKLNKEKIIKELGQSIFSRNVILRKTINSTNLFAKELAKKGVPEGTVVITEEQTAGRGRMDRRWLSQGYRNLLFSILVRPPVPVDQVFVLTMIVAIAAIDGVKALYDLNALIKWPNDIYINKRKLGGVLTEFSAKEKKTEYIIIGLGLNVNWSPGEGDGILYPSTSILAETGAGVSRNELLVKILKSFESYYRQLLSGRIDELYEKWNELSMVKGKEVQIHSHEGIIRGLALGIDPSGVLIIRDEKGVEQRIVSGDISIRI